jgi:transposase
LRSVTGTDLTQVDGIDVTTGATILSEAGWDMSKWEDEDHFVSWLRLCPDNRISGNKVLGKGRLLTNNRAVKISAYSGRVCLEQVRKENGTAEAVPTSASEGRDQK